MKSDRPRLIVVDDEPDILASVNDLLRRRYDLELFESGADALAALMSDPGKQMILADQRMPGISGVEVLRRARGISPNTTRVLMTGYADLATVMEAVNEGNVFRFLPKPWQPADLELTVRQAVEQHRLVADRERLIEELREKNDKLRESDRLKDMFIEVASHELNTPVTIILGLSDLWRLTVGKDAGDQERAWIDRIHRAGKRLASTIERMFRLVRSEELSKHLDRREVELTPLLYESAETIAPYLELRGQHIVVSASSDLGSAFVDPTKVSDILNNLLVNAVKFTPDGGRIELRARSLGSEEIEIQVSDTGIGIKSEETKHLFEPFFTGYDTLHHSSGEFQFGKRGIGLGLCLVKAFTESHGGDVTVVTREGEGSTFTVRLPRTPPEPTGEGAQLEGFEASP